MPKQGDVESCSVGHNTIINLSNIGLIDNLTIINYYSI